VDRDNRFCASCGARLLPDAVFCVECGQAQGGRPARRIRMPPALHRYAPVFVVLVIAAVVGTAVMVGTLAPKTPPPAPGRGNAEVSGNLPAGHPPIAVPEQVKQIIQDMQKKADAAPNDLDTWKRLAEMQYRAGQVDATYLTAAEKSYRHILEIEPENSDVLRNIGNIAFDQDQPDVATEYYEKYLKLKPDDLNVQTDLGTMYLSAGRAEQALKQFESVLKQDPSFFQAQFNLAIAYRTIGQSDKVVPALEKARGMAKDDQTRQQVDQLLAHLKSGQQEGAGPAPAPAAQSPAAAEPQAAAMPAGGSFQGDAEAVFREHPIIGPKLQRIEWSGPESAKVYLTAFPLDQMPPEMLGTFKDRMKSRIKETKDAHDVAQTAKFELIDAESGKVMETIEQ
jgi:tetratricopeptide (TPR) repeat protein